MSRDVDMSNPEGWSDEDVIYLAQRNRLPDDPELEERARSLLSGLAEPTPIGDLVNTGTVNTAGLTQEEFDRAVELLRAEQEGGGFESSDSDSEDEDYSTESGWNQDGRRDELKTRGLVTSGDKETMIDRLLRSDRDELTAEDYPDGKVPEEVSG